MNKNSSYVQSLVNFLHDTKPYHSKLTEVVEEYRFNDDLNVRINERVFENLKLKAAWMYQYFSGGISENQVTVAHPITVTQTPLLLSVGASVPEFPQVPQVYDPRAFDGPGIAYASLQRANGQVVPYLEGHDVFQSHGAYVFQIHQTISTHPIAVGSYERTFDVTEIFPQTITLPFSADSLSIAGPALQVSFTQISVYGPGRVHVNGLSSVPPYRPLFSEKRNADVIAEASAAAVSRALGNGPGSVLQRVTSVLNAIDLRLQANPDATASAELSALRTIISNGNLPRSFEALINALINAGTPVINGYQGWRVDIAAWVSPFSARFVELDLDSFVTELALGNHSDIAEWESGALFYAPVRRADFIITDISSSSSRANYEEWTLEVITDTTLTVHGSVSGVIGIATVPSTFSAPQVTFTIAAGTVTPTIGDEIRLTPAARVTIHADAPRETWSIIKTNPRTYTRPVFSSTRYGYVMDGSGVRNSITVVNTGMVSGTIVLTALSSSTFSVRMTAVPSYEAVATVGSVFNDGQLAFTLVQGSSYPFQVGDAFYAEIINEPPKAEDLDLYFGYDVDAYDAGNLVYNNTNAALQDYLKTLDFGYDSRFTGYDLNAFNLTLTPTAQDNRQWRLRAVPDTTKPLLMHASVPTARLNLLGTDDPTNPNAPELFDSANDFVVSEGNQSSTDPDSVTDIMVWYSNSFALEYWDGAAWVLVDTVNVGDSYTNSTHGLSFTVVPAAKPFIGTRVTSSRYDTYPANLANPVIETVDGGDLIAWTTRNSPPKPSDAVTLSSPNVTHLWMHGDSFYDTPAASWTLVWQSATDYLLQGTYTHGTLSGQPVFLGTGVVVRSTDGKSYRNADIGLHWTLYSGVVGEGPGDRITFNTTVSRPSFLVYGSNSGWQPDAEIDRWYWNGKIGFNISKPVIDLFENGTRINGPSWLTSSGNVILNGLRDDAPTMCYVAKAHVPGFWTLYRDGLITAYGADRLRDEYIHLEMPVAVQGASLVMSIHGDEHAMALGQDLVLVRTDAGRSSKVGDSVSISKVRVDDVQLSIKPKDPAHAVALQPLAPATTDLRFVDHNALSGVPLSGTSPETGVLQGWLSLGIERYDGSTIAEFNDTPAFTVLRSSATGETIGKLTSLGANPLEPVVMQWDSAFASRYLPLNAEATLVTLGNGFNDLTRVRMTEGIIFLLDGPNSSSSTLFNDTLDIKISDDPFWRVRLDGQDSASALVLDGPFVGFAPGYDNLLYDEETTNGYYDAGLPLTAHFARAKVLANLDVHEPKPVLTQSEADELSGLLGLIGGFLVNGDLASTSISDFIDQVNAAASADAIETAPTTGFGVPQVGLAIDTTQDEGGVAGALISESITVISSDGGTQYDLRGFDVGLFDVQPESSVSFIISSFPTSVDVATTAAIALSGLQTIDGIVLAAGARVLVKNQLGTNGIYVVSAGSWMLEPTQLGSIVQVMRGTTQAGTAWSVDGTVSSVFFSGITQYVDFETPLISSSPSTVVNLQLSFAYSGIPTIFVWLPAWTRPVRAIPEVISSRVFRLTIPSSSEFKLIAG